MNVCDNLGDHLVGNVYIKVINKSISHILNLYDFKTLVYVVSP